MPVGHDCSRRLETCRAPFVNISLRPQLVHGNFQQIFFLRLRMHRLLFFVLFPFRPAYIGCFLYSFYFETYSPIAVCMDSVIGPIAFCRPIYLFQPRRLPKATLHGYTIQCSARPLLCSWRYGLSDIMGQAYELYDFLFDFNGNQAQALCVNIVPFSSYSITGIGSRSTDMYEVFSARCNIIHLVLMLRCQCPSVCPSICL